MKKLLLSILTMMVGVLAMSAAEDTFDFKKNTYGHQVITDGQDKNYLDNGTAFQNEGSPITMTCFKTDGKNGYRFWNNTGLRFFKNSDAGFTMEATGENTITKIEITGPAKSGFKLADGQPGTYDAGTWTGDASSITFDYTSTSNTSIEKIVVTYSSAAVVPGQDLTAPEISMEAHNMVSIYQAEEAATYYTVDGTEPLENGKLTSTAKEYTAPFAITAPCTVKAAAFEDGSFSEVVSTTVYLNEVSSISAFVANGSPKNTLLNNPVSVLYKNGRYLWVKDATDYILIYNGDDIELPAMTNGQKIATVTGTYKLQNNAIPEIVPASIGAITDGTAIEPTTAKLADITAADVNKYFRLVNVSITAAEKANNYTIAQGSDQITGYNQFSNAAYYDVLEVPQGDGFTVEGFVSVYSGNVQFIFSKISGGTVKETVATPEITPNGGELSEGDEITITCATEGSTIYYTTNGDDPAENGNEYTGAIKFSGSAMTVKAIATKADWLDSEMATAEFTLLIQGQKSVTFDFAKDGNATSLTDESILASTNDKEFEEDGTTRAGNNLNGVYFTNGPVSLVIEKASATTPPRWWSLSNGSELRLYGRTKDDEYQGNDVIISNNTNGYRIVKVEFLQGNTTATNFSSVNFTLPEENGTWNKETHTWTANANALVNRLVLNPAANIRFGGIKVTYVEDPNGVNSIDGIAQDNSNAPVEYYNLQGMRMNGDNLRTGIYIRRQGTDVKKVYIAR